MAIPLLFVAGGVAATAVSSVIGWRARGAVDEFSGNYNTAQNTLGTFQLILILALLYGSYRFVREFKK